MASFLGLRIYASLEVIGVKNNKIMSPKEVFEISSYWGMASFFDFRIYASLEVIGSKNNKMLYLFLGENGIIFPSSHIREFRSDWFQKQ